MAKCRDAIDEAKAPREMPKQLVQIEQVFASYKHTHIHLLVYCKLNQDAFLTLNTHKESSKKKKCRKLLLFTTQIYPQFEI